jgi:hypothetical protein
MKFVELYGKVRYAGGSLLLFPYTRALRPSLQRDQRPGVPVGIKTGDLAQ